MSSEITSYHPYSPVKYCPGCEQFLSVDLFGIDNSLKSKISTRCRKCNNERTRRVYEKKKLAKIPVQKESKFLYIKLKMHPPLEFIRKHCPSCKAIIYICPKNKEDSCPYCKKGFTLHHKLSKIKLEKIEPERKYNEEILKIVSENKTWIADLARTMNLSEGKIRYELNKLEKEGFLYRSGKGQIKYIHLRKISNVGK